VCRVVDPDSVQVVSKVVNEVSENEVVEVVESLSGPTGVMEPPVGETGLLELPPLPPAG